MIKVGSSLSRIRIIYIVTTIFLVALCSYASIQLKHLLDSYDWINHTNQVNLSFQSILIAVTDVDNNQKNFVLTGDSSCLAKRDSVFNTLTKELNKAAMLVKDNHEQYENVKMLGARVNEKLLAITKENPRDPPFGASSNFKSGISGEIHSSETVRHLIDKMTLNEMHLLEQRTREHSNRANVARLFIFLLFLGALAILLVSYFRINSVFHQAKRLKRIVDEKSSKLDQTLISKKLLEEGEQKYRELSSSLEEKVRERTFELEKINGELRFSEDRYHRMVVEIQDYAIILLSKDGIIENWNKGAENIKGYKAEEIIGKSFSSFYPPEEQAKRVPQKLLAWAKENGKSSDENWRVRKDGTKFWGSVVITALRDNKNEIVGFVKITRDLTERRHAEEEIRAKAKQVEEKNVELEMANKELQSFAYISSHDLQEPLRKIQTFATRILEKDESNLSESGKRNFMGMHVAAKRMQTLIRDLLEYSRAKTTDLHFETTDLGKIIDEVKENLKEELNEKHATIDTPELCKVYVIPFQFRQLMTNLIGNAIKFSKLGSPPHIRIESKMEERAELNNDKLSTTKRYCHISLTDNGIGFEQQFSEKIFELFQRLHGKTEYAGTGIGLAIVKKIIENHRGFITARGEVDKGARFDIYIPSLEGA
ncbi:MAG TPA: PAS domain S-box protein [Cyclobacteriaceae bacterium]|jgi:PAS domain S-box-containing protein|nr:PAS domain S-box protein [Cyclobacteriaceae bacterium]